MFAMKNLAGRIIAFEPDPGNYARLMANLERQRAGRAGRGDAARARRRRLRGDALRRRKWNRGRVHHRGAGADAAGGHVHACGRRASTTSTPSPGKTIIVKMDVEGYEFQALAGMERTLRDNACYLQVEHYGTEFERAEGACARATATGSSRTHDIDHLFHQHRRYLIGGERLSADRLPQSHSRRLPWHIRRLTDSSPLPHRNVQVDMAKTVNKATKNPKKTAAVGDLFAAMDKPQQKAARLGERRVRALGRVERGRSTATPPSTSRCWRGSSRCAAGPACISAAPTRRRCITCSRK